MTDTEAIPTACACGRKHASWWRTTQAPSCGVPRSVIHDGVIYSSAQWNRMVELAAAAGMDLTDH